MRQFTWSAAFLFAVSAISQTLPPGVQKVSRHSGPFGGFFLRRKRCIGWYRTFPRALKARTADRLRGRGRGKDFGSLP